MHYGWEIADIGVLIIFRINKKVFRTKVLLLQSKRLYPLSATSVSEDDLHHYMAGFSRLMPEKEDYDADMRSRTHKFDWSSKYEAIKKGDTQEAAVIEYQKATGIPVFYLLYNPGSLPWEVDVPLIQPFNSVRCYLGCRIVPFDTMQVACAKLPKSGSPSIDDIRSVNSKSPRKYASLGYTIEDFIADRVLGCHEGHIIEGTVDASLERVFFRRTAPISAAIAITIDMPGE